jgi:predicted dehydrogenase
MAGPRVALIGIHGHGRVHLTALLEREQAGRLELRALADPRAPAAGPEAQVLRGRTFDTDAQRMLRTCRADIVVIAAPIHTHAELAALAMRSGAHVLLEKPPVTTVAELDRLLAIAAATRRHCQVGFQAFGSSAARDLPGRLAGGQLGAVERISVVGCWRRGADYYSRARWAGRRRLDGIVVADGVLTNPFAHGIALALRLAATPRAAAVPVRDVRVEPYHAYPIETDDTTSARIETGTGVRVTAAATLCAEREYEPYVRIHAQRGQATLWYTEDRLLIEPDGGIREETVGERTALIDDLIAHLDDDPADESLCSPLQAARPFTEVLEAIWRGPQARPIPERYLRLSPYGRTIPGIEDVVAEAGENGRLFSEMDLPWTAEAVHGKGGEQA